MAEAIRDGLRLEAIAADIAGDGDTALELLGVNAYDIAVLDRDIPGPSGDEIARRIVASGSGMPILMLTAADRLDDKASGFELGADDYLTKPFELRELVLRLRALDRRRAHSRPPVREIAGLRLDPFRREVYRDGRYVALTRKQFAVLEVLVAAEGGVVSAEELLERAWDENADPFTNAVRITVSALRKRLGEPWVIATVAGVGYRIDAAPTPDAEVAKSVDRAPGLSVRLKLTLSYAGFLDGRRRLLLLRRVWVACCATCRLPSCATSRADVISRSGPFVPGHAPTSCAPSRRRRPSCWPSCSSFGLLGGWLLAGRMLAPLTPDHRRHPTGRERIALPPDRAGGPQRRVPRARRHLRHHARAARGARRRAAAVRRQRLPRAAHPAGDHADAARRGPQRPEPRHRASSSTASTPSTPGRSTSPRRCSCSAAPTSGPSPARTVDLSLVAEEAAETLLPLRRAARRHHRDLRRRGAHRRLTRAAAPAGDEPRAQRDRPQPARRRRRLGHHRGSTQRCRAHRREHRREAHAAAGRDARRAVPARHRAHPHRPRGVGLGLAIVESITPGARRSPHRSHPGRKADSASRWSCPPRSPPVARNGTGAQRASRMISASVRSGPGHSSRMSGSPPPRRRLRSTSATTTASSSCPATGMKSGTRSNGSTR